MIIQKYTNKIRQYETHFASQEVLYLKFSNSSHQKTFEKEFQKALASIFSLIDDRPQQQQ